MKWKLVRECGSWDRGRWQWKLIWRRPLLGRELIWEQALLHEISLVQLHEGVPDGWIWLPNTDGLFSVQSAYLFLQESDLPEADPVFISVWTSFAPSNVKGFAWRVLLDRIACRENLLKRRVIASISDASCVFCNSHLESSFHVLFSCPFSMQIWQGCFQWLGCSLFQSNTIREHFFQFRFGTNKLQQRLSHSIWLAAIWSLWLVRNDIFFRGGTAAIEVVLESIKRRSWQWNKANMRGFSYSSSDWFLNPHLCIVGS
ncbi:uncharacterized protein LOC130735120 [Lotus japonicus]|uniref:uncharacterized protein LOC130735120 n=1 Tax=Lotus japonicus TaxID=34305 RepID=UPI0025847C22|nr:uncharacterized protein LOC130735120 [Lotus japonicus]